MQHAERFDSTTIALHWAVALLVVAQWASGQTIDWFGKGAPRVDARSVHLVIGSLIAIAIAIRIWWRLGPGKRLPPANTGFWDVAARGLQGLLYVMVVGVVLGGIATELLRGDSFFGLFTLPKPGDLQGAARHALSEKIGDLHGLGANIVLILAGLHSAAALFHQYVLRDGLLRRMGWA